MANRQLNLVVHPYWTTIIPKMTELSIGQGKNSRKITVQPGSRQSPAAEETAAKRAYQNDEAEKPLWMAPVSGA